MTTLNEELSDAKAEIDDVREYLREELPQFFAFDVTVGNIAYNANTNTVSATVEPSSDARSQLSETLGGVHVATDGRLEFEFGLDSASSGT